MKTITTLLLLMTLLTTGALRAQTTIGFNAGLSFANVVAKSEGISASPKSKTGFTGGILLNVPVSATFSFQPALHFVQKGYKVKDDFGSEEVTLNYLEVPLNFVYNTSAKGGFFIGAGPAFSYGISGTDKSNYNGGTMPSQNEKIKFGSDDEEVKAVDLGANILAGFRLPQGLMLSANYNLGLTKINNDAGSDDGSIKNKYFSVKIGYMLHSKAKK